MNVRAKMRIDSVTQHAPSGDSRQVDVTCRAVSGADNAKWARYTPSGTLTLSINNPEAAAFFAPGKHIYLDISDAPAKDE